MFWLVFVAACGLLGWAYLAVIGPPAWIPVQVDRVLAHPARGGRPRLTSPDCQDDGVRAAEYAFFDAPFLAFAHRGGADVRPERRPREHPPRLRRGRRARLPLPRDRRPRHGRRRPAGLPRPAARPGDERFRRGRGADHGRARRGPDRRPRPHPHVRRAARGLPGRPVQRRRQGRAGRRPARRRDRRPRRVRPGVRQLVLPGPAAPAAAPARPSRPDRRRARAGSCCTGSRRG